MILLSQRECDYVLELADAFNYPYFSEQIKRVMYMRSTGMSFNEIDKQRGAHGAANLYRFAKWRVKSVCSRAESPLYDADCFALLRIRVESLTTTRHTLTAHHEKATKASA